MGVCPCRILADPALGHPFPTRNSGWNPEPHCVRHDPKSSHFLLPQQPYCHRAFCNVASGAGGPYRAPNPLFGASTTLAVLVLSSFILNLPDTFLLKMLPSSFYPQSAVTQESQTRAGRWTVLSPDTQTPGQTPTCALRPWGPPALKQVPTSPSHGALICFSSQERGQPGQPGWSRSLRQPAPFLQSRKDGEES